MDPIGLHSAVFLERTPFSSLARPAVRSRRFHGDFIPRRDRLGRCAEKNNEATAADRRSTCRRRRDAGNRRAKLARKRQVPGGWHHVERCAAAETDTQPDPYRIVERIDGTTAGAGAGPDGSDTIADSGDASHIKRTNTSRRDFDWPSSAGTEKETARFDRITAIGWDSVNIGRISCGTLQQCTPVREAAANERTRSSCAIHSCPFRNAYCRW